MSSASLLSSGALESLAAIDTVSFRGLVEQIWESIDHFGVELRVVAAAILVLLLDVMVPLKFSKYLAWVSVGLCLWIAGSLMGHHLEPEHSRLFLGMISYDSFSSFYKLLFIVGIVPVILMGYVSNSLQGRRMGEFYALLFISVFGAMLMASSTHFIMLFMSLEILSISSYVLVGYLRRDRGGVEASLKYIIYGSIASAIMAFGMSLYYGLTGSADLADLAHVVRADGPLGDKDSSRIAIMTLVSLLMIFAGIAYKIASVPMHFWAPDAYEGAPTAVTAFLAVISKAAGLALALRFFQSLNDSVAALNEADPSYLIWNKFLGLPGESPWILIVMMISVLTMTIGNLSALWQTNLKRLFAYSSIAHAGYMMMGLTILHGGGSVGGVEAISFYVVAYLAMNFGAFAIVLLIENRTGSAEISACAGVGRSSPLLGAAMIVFLFSLIGIPPTGGFTGKFELFMGVLDMGRPEYYALAVAAAINTAISAYYYLRIAKEMYFSDDANPEEIRIGVLGKVLVLSMVLLTFYLFFQAQGILETAKGLELKV